MSLRVQAISGALFDAHRGGSAVRDPGDLTLEEAYSIQEAVYARLSGGSRPVAWKVGGPSERVEPIGAQILPGGLFPNAAAISVAGFRMIAVEAEVGFRLGAEAQAAEALVTIEVCDTRLADWADASAMAKLADFQSNAALVAGSGSTQWRAIDFKAQRAELWVDGRKVREASGAHPYGNPARLLPWAAAHCAARGNSLRAGDIVTTGSWTGMELVPAGSTVRAVFPGIGEATVKLKAN